jgi:protein-S-isoprenylcysteine O-methyltransferase Ste14
MRLPPPVIGLAAGVAQRVLTPGAPPPTFARRAAAGLTAGAAVGLMGSAVKEFRARGTTVDPIHPERASALVTTGPFALTRNPMYVGMAGLLAAHMIARGSLKALLPVAAFVVVIDRVQIPPEEAAMSQLFAGDYESYRARSPRWVGV